MSPGVSLPVLFPLSLWIVVQGLSLDAIRVLPKGVAYPVPLSPFDGSSYTVLVCDPPQLLICDFDGPPQLEDLTQAFVDKHLYLACEALGGLPRFGAIFFSFYIFKKQHSG